MRGPIKILYDADRPASLLTEPMIVAYELMLDGYVYQLLAGTAHVCALIKVIEPDTFQRIGKGNKVAAKKIIVRWSEKKGLHSSKGRLKAINADKVEEILKAANSMVFVPTFVLSSHQQGKIIGVLNGRTINDITNPKVHPVVVISIDMWVPNHSEEKRVAESNIKIDIASDGEQEFEIIGDTWKENRRAFPIIMPPSILKELRKAAREILTQNI